VWRARGHSRNGAWKNPRGRALDDLSAVIIGTYLPTYNMVCYLDCVKTEMEIMEIDLWHVFVVVLSSLLSRGAQTEWWKWHELPWPRLLYYVPTRCSHVIMILYCTTMPLAERSPLHASRSVCSSNRRSIDDRTGPGPRCRHVWILVKIMSLDRSTVIIAVRRIRLGRDMTIWRVARRVRWARRARKVMMEFPIVYQTEMVRKQFVRVIAMDIILTI